MFQATEHCYLQFYFCAIDFNGFILQEEKNRTDLKYAHTSWHAIVGEKFHMQISSWVEMQRKLFRFESLISHLTL